MGSRLEYVNVSGLRLDGRRPHEVRRLLCRLGASPGSDGSALVEQGGTRVLACVHGPREAARRGAAADRERGGDGCSVACEVLLAPFAGHERRKRRAGDRRLAEAAASLRASLESVMLAKLYPRSQVDVFVLVLQADGGVLAAAVNAACLALIDAGVALRDFVVACGVTHVQRASLLDPSQAECSAGGPELVVALLPRSGKLTLATMDARLPMEQLEPCLALAAEGCAQIFEVMRSAAREATQRKAVGDGGGGGEDGDEEGVGGDDGEGERDAGDAAGDAGANELS